MSSTNSPDLKALRHSAEHVLMQAMEQLFPGKILKAMGPATNEGFYFDFETLDELKLSKLDFETIEKKMQTIINQDLPFTKKEITPDEANKLFANNQYKQEWIKEAESRGEAIIIYYTGDPKEKGSFADLCSGPHVKSTDEVKAFKLLSIAGAYWRGSEKNKMLTRIYGTAFKSKKDLDQYLTNLAESEKRDHRKLGKELSLFSFSEDVGPGLPLWLPNGTIIRDELENWAKETEKQRGYVRVATPHIAKHTLYETSGHLPYYKDDMYSPMEIDGEEYYLKGMNCPHHHMIYKSSPKSYRDLPLKLAEYGTVYRYEQSGSLFGLMRVRSIAQNDAHIYCPLNQAEAEFLEVLKLHQYYYHTLGLTEKDYYIVIGLPDEKKRDKYHGDKKLWDQAEKMMKNAIKKSGIKAVDDIGGAAFYGPKIDFNIISSTGREFGISTNQLDLYMPTRFDLTYTASDGSNQPVAVIHRAPLGSHERFIGFLIEHFAGAFPVWLSPVQVGILPISEKFLNYANNVKQDLLDQNIRVELDDSNESLAKKIRNAEDQKTPYMLIIGAKETDKKTVSLRQRGEKDLGSMKLALFSAKIQTEIKNKLIF